MPYDNIDELPDSVKKTLPGHAREIYRAAFNNAWDEYAGSESRKDGASREEVAHRVAWAAVKKKYEKKDGSWQAR